MMPLKYVSTAKLMELFDLFTPDEMRSTARILLFLRDALLDMALNKNWRVSDVAKAISVE